MPDNVHGDPRSLCRVWPGRYSHGAGSHGGRRRVDHSRGSPAQLVLKLERGVPKGRGRQGPRPVGLVVFGQGRRCVRSSMLHRAGSSIADA
jgi:hypothetical protein